MEQAIRFGWEHALAGIVLADGAEVAKACQFPFGITLDELIEVPFTHRVICPEHAHRWRAHPSLGGSKVRFSCHWPTRPRHCWTKYGYGQAGTPEPVTIVPAATHSMRPTTQEVLARTSKAPRPCGRSRLDDTDVTAVARTKMAETGTVSFRQSTMRLRQGLFRH